MGFSYAKAGVHVDKVKQIHSATARLLQSTLHANVLLPAGHYSGLVEIGGQKIALHTDGVGTKVLVAQQLAKFDTVGIDCVAMNVNDLVCIGAKPVSLVDYLAVEKADPKLIAGVMKGLVVGARQAGVSIIGGETAIVPELIKGEGGGKGFDLSATCIGVVEGPLVTGKATEEGDAVIGLASTGLHSNGYTLARKVLLPGKPPFERRLLLEMLTPTQIYSPAVLDVLERASVHGLAHITGGAFSKLLRILPKDKGILLDAMPKPARIFREIQAKGKISDREMYRTLNMGVGFCVVCPEREAGKVVAASKRHGIFAARVGTVTGKHEVLLKKGKKALRLA